MGAWTYIKRVTADQTGGAEAVPVELERNPDAVVELGAENPPDLPLFILRVGIEGGFGRTRAGIPVYRRPNASPHPVLKEIYHCEVAGKTLEAANIHALREKVRAQLDVIAPAHSLPLCYFRAPRYDYSLAVYEQGGKLVCPVLAGPKLRAEGLAELRTPVIRHLRTSGYLGAQEEPEVLVVRPSDLRLVPPACTVCSVDDPELWIPTVEGTSAEGPVVGLLSHPTELAAPRRRLRRPVESELPPFAGDVTGVLRYLGAELLRERHLIDPWRLYASAVRPEIWARTEEITDPTSRVLTAHMEGGMALEMAIRHTAAGESVAALSDRERGICVFLAGDDDALAAVAGRFLAAAGFVRDPGDLRPEAVPEAPAETLDPSLIRTHEKEDVFT